MDKNNVFAWVCLIICIAIICVLYYLYEKSKKKKSMLRLVIGVIFIDEKLTDEEIKKLNRYCEKNRISKRMLSRQMKKIAKHERIEFRNDVFGKKRERNIQTLVDFMLVDGTIDEKELELIKQVAQAYGLSDDYVDNLLKRQ